MNIVSKQFSEKEDRIILDELKKGTSRPVLANMLNKNINTLGTRITFLRKEYDIYNKKFREVKYSQNISFLKLLLTRIKNPTVLDVFAGRGRFWFNYLNRNSNLVLDNDINGHKFKDNERMNMEDAITFMRRLIKEGKRFDLVDLDPFNDAMQYIELFVLLLKPKGGLIITLGGYSSYQHWNHLHIIRDRYSIDSFDGWHPLGIEEAIVKKAREYGVELECNTKLSYNKILRYYFNVKSVSKSTQNIFRDLA